MGKGNISLMLVLLILWSCNPQGGDVTLENTEVQPLVSYDESGEQIVRIAQYELLRNLDQAMEAGGPAHAVNFCNERISPTMDSLSRVHHATISRVSLKNRNPNNIHGTDLEKAVLHYYEDLKQRQQYLTDTLYETDHRAVYFKPILITRELCLSCHGPVASIDTATLKIIQERYPDDKATGYKMGNLRGMWKVAFEKNPSR